MAHNDQMETKRLLDGGENSGLDRFPPAYTRTGGMSAQLRHLVRPTLAELFATFMFVLIGVTAVRNNSVEPIDLVGIALAHGMMIFLLVSMTAHVSGGHINPAVTLGLFLSGEIGLIRLILYWIAQFLGGIIGAALALGLSNDMIDINYGEHNPASADIIYNGQAFVVEIFTTIVLVLTVHCAAVDPKGPKALTPFCIGMAVTAGIVASGRLTGASMNPARSFGPAFVSLDALRKHSDIYTSIGSHAYWVKFWKAQWIYIFGPLFGGAIASIIYRFLLSSQPCPRPRVMERITAD